MTVVESDSASKSRRGEEQGETKMAALLKRGEMGQSLQQGSDVESQLLKIQVILSTGHRCLEVYTIRP